MNIKRLIVNGTIFSEPGTMGGNTKILIEIIRELAKRYDVHVILPDFKVKTLEDAGLKNCGMTVHPFPRFRHSDFLRPISSVIHYYREFSRILDGMGAGKDDVLIGAGDFHSDALTTFFLRLKYRFKWIASTFLFMPSALENLVKGYGFSALLCIVARLNAKFFMLFSRTCAAGYLITSRDDFRHFPRKFRDGRIFPFYGGVNVEQIPSEECPKSRDVVFCSRLCAQKGIMGFLDVWRLALDRSPALRLTVIGNGRPKFEKALRDKAARLGVDGSIEWMGYVNNEEKYRIYRSCRVMVHPTVFDNNGMVAAEALCSGLPVVMFDLPPLRHVYKEGCIKVPFGDKRAFADAILNALEAGGGAAPSPEEVALLRERWSWPNRMAAFEKWLLSVIARSEATKQSSCQ